MTMIRHEMVVIGDDDTLVEYDAALAELAIWRHESPEAMARFNVVLDERCARGRIEGKTMIGP